MLRFNFIHFFLVLCSLNAIGQKLELDRVTKSELLERHHKKDTSASAAIIFKKAITDFKYSEKDGFEPVTTFQIKIKVYKKEGLKWADFKIPYYVGYKNLEDEYVDIISGYTYNLENDKIVKSKVTGQGKFREKVNEYWESKSVTFPNVKVGSVIELEYKLKSQNIQVLPEFQYQYEIPVNNAIYKTYIPDFYIYNVMRRGFVEIGIDQKMESRSQSFEDKVDIASVGRILSYNQIISDYAVSDVPALKGEDFVNNIDNYYGKIEHELKLIQYPDEKPKQIATTWEAVAKSIYEDVDFNSALKDFQFFKNEIAFIMSNTTTKEETIQKIFNLVKSRMSWNGRYGYYPIKKTEIAYAEKVGNVAEINLMLVSMLRMAGIDANPVLISTRENGFALFPNKTILNYVIVAAKIEDKLILLDATDKLSDLNTLPIRALNWQGRLIKNDGTFVEIDLMPKSNSKDSVTILASINDQGEILGKIREQYFDYCAYVFRQNYNGIAKESYIEKLEKENQGIEIKSYDVQNSIDLKLPIIENYEFISTNSVEIIGDKMYVSPFLFFEIEKNPFQQEKREYPIDFVFPRQYKFNVNLNIPNGYIVETLPNPKAVAMPDNLGNFNFNVSYNGMQIQLLFTQDINKAVIEPEYYEVLKNFFKEIVNKQTEKIVLKKA